mmetsp:Transcript_8430/g.12737  ORF Transcript_8430/g.12737 Transcript_8430/m.12737 type:complete len:173 (-) Transcript_8430:57-575(-)|eukprot:CAMPEP_0201522596 /NCGR_PEP_ID=MMETSP0161_2-20130828/18309_1 /ASSEMBLY_ACC=CAM_ASM_000251 /TAXON_ID=180227 /ORGANISM="Neoparamoeba aestuarina, Strain SoJaBio B1-5/56/2" /LENGTH=172 /DNA_ID=CAMNT_0047921495 /DNA_START=30 /DNA_END=548 /DNA_ORIENTATION=+
MSQHDAIEAATPVQDSLMDPVLINKTLNETKPTEAARPVHCVVPIEESVALAASANEAIPTEEAPAVDPPVKRPVGRPRKHPVEQSPSKTKVAEKKPVKVGRPKKNPVQGSPKKTKLTERPPGKPESPTKKYNTRAQMRAIDDSATPSSTEALPSSRTVTLNVTVSMTFPLE